MNQMMSLSGLIGIKGIDRSREILNILHPVEDFKIYFLTKFTEVLRDYLKKIIEQSNIDLPNDSLDNMFKYSIMLDNLICEMIEKYPEIKTLTTGPGYFMKFFSNDESIDTSFIDVHKRVYHDYNIYKKHENILFLMFMASDNNVFFDKIENSDFHFDANLITRIYQLNELRNDIIKKQMHQIDVFIINALDKCNELNNIMKGIIELIEKIEIGIKEYNNNLKKLLEMKITGTHCCENIESCNNSINSLDLEIDCIKNNILALFSKLERPIKKFNHKFNIIKEITSSRMIEGNPECLDYLIQNEKYIPDYADNQKDVPKIKINIRALIETFDMNKMKLSNLEKSRNEIKDKLRIFQDQNLLFQRSTDEIIDYKKKFIIPQKLTLNAMVTLIENNIITLNTILSRNKMQILINRDFIDLIFALNEDYKILPHFNQEIRLLDHYSFVTNKEKKRLKEIYNE